MLSDDVAVVIMWDFQPWGDHRQTFSNGEGSVEPYSYRISGKQLDPFGIYCPKQHFLTVDVTVNLARPD
ncbi:MAG: hypothetical protein ACYDDO_08040 [Acidiferrobacterales bacterium]